MEDIKLILQGGGTRCSYQMEFLNTLNNNNVFTDKFNVIEIYGTSFGALVGYFFCINKLDVLNEFFLSINPNSLKRHFDFWGFEQHLHKIPIIGNIITSFTNIIWLSKSIINKSLYDQSHGIEDLFKNNITPENCKQLEKFRCCVYNITKQRIEYINGSHPLIIEYILASSALWIMFKPRMIKKLNSECVCDDSCNCSKYNENYTYSVNPYHGNFCTCNIDTHRINEYMDGGILKAIPFEPNNTYIGKYLILTTKDIEKIHNKHFAFNNSGKHLFEYIDNIITFLIEYNQYMDLLYTNKNWYTDKNIYLINYKSKTNNPAILDQKFIKEYINDGKIMANDFILSLNSSTNYNRIII